MALGKKHRMGDGKNRFFPTATFVIKGIYLFSKMLPPAMTSSMMIGLTTFDIANDVNHFGFLQS